MEMKAYIQALLETQGSFSTTIEKCKKLADEVDVELKTPREATQQQNCADQPNQSTEEFYRWSINIPYLDSLIT